jgi:hypothetical protein
VGDGDNHQGDEEPEPVASSTPAQPGTDRRETTTRPPSPTGVASKPRSTARLGEAKQPTLLVIHDCG